MQTQNKQLMLLRELCICLKEFVYLYSHLEENQLEFIADEVFKDCSAKFYV